MRFVAPKKKDSVEWYYFYIVIYIITAKNAMQYHDLDLSRYRPSLPTTRSRMLWNYSLFHFSTNVARHNFFSQPSDEVEQCT